MLSNERDLRELVRPLRRRWWLIVAIAVAVAGGTYQYYRNQQATFVASTNIFVGASALGGVLGQSSAGGDPRAVQNQARLLKTREVARRVATALKFQGDPQVLLSQVNATPAEDSDFVTITSTAATPAAAIAIANGFAKAFVELRSDEVREDAGEARREIQAQIKTLGRSARDLRTREQLQQQLQNIRLVESFPSGRAEQVDRARTATRISVQPRRNAIFGGVLGLILGALVVSGLAALDRRLRGSDVESDYQAPLLAVLPDDGRAIDRSKKQANLADGLVEPVRMLRTTLSVTSVNGSGPPRSILVTSAIPEEGKSTLTRSLALAYYEAGLCVLVIDADLRRPTLSSALGVEPDRGLTEVLLGETTLLDAVVPAALETDPVLLDRNQRMLQLDDAPRTVFPLDGSMVPDAGPARERGAQVAVLSAGRRVSDPAALFGTRKMATLLEEAARLYDIVLIDTAPLLAVSDAIPLLSHVDGVLLVTRFNHTTRDDAKRARQLIGRVPHVHLLGVVANGATSDDASYPYAYSGAP